MTQGAWRKMRLADVLARPAIRTGLAQALAAGPLCDHCLGRLVAGADTGLANNQRGRAVREALAVPAPPATCSLCGGLLGSIDAWAARAAEALRGWEFEAIGVATRPDPQVTQREEALWQMLLSAAAAQNPWESGRASWRDRVSERV
jgi:tRNA pseudouridine synthase 10